MSNFSANSLARLRTCHPDLQRLFQEVIKTHDCAILVGFRDHDDQEAAFASGVSKDHWPHSKHNAQPSLACDVMPYPVNWDDAPGIAAFASVVKFIADKLGIGVRWGGDFRSLSDRDHWELVSPPTQS